MSKTLLSVSILVTCSLAQRSPDTSLYFAIIFPLVFGIGIPLLCCLVAVCFAIKKKAENDRVRAEIAQVGFNFQQQHPSLSHPIIPPQNYYNYSQNGQNYYAQTYGPPDYATHPSNNGSPPRQLQETYIVKPE